MFFRQITLETNSFHFCGASALLAITVTLLARTRGSFVCLRSFIPTRNKLLDKDFLFKIGIM